MRLTTASDLDDRRLRVSARPGSPQRPDVEVTAAEAVRGRGPAALVVRVVGTGAPSPADLRRALATLADGALPVVLDLRDTDAAGQWAALDATARAAGEAEVAWCVVPARGQAPLQVGTVAPAAFRTAGDALQALAFAAQGYGPGWA